MKNFSVSCKVVSVSSEFLLESLIFSSDFSVVVDRTFSELADDCLLLLKAIFTLSKSSRAPKVIISYKIIQVKLYKC